MNPVHAADSDQVHSHVSSPAQLIGIFLALIGLTGVTVWSASFDAGQFDVWIALGIAGLKAGLVAAYFMHLRYDNPINTLLLVFSIGIVVLFLGVTLSDAVQLSPEVEAAAPVTVPST